MFLRPLAFVAAIALLAAADGQVIGDDVLSWPLVSVCQVLAAPQAFNGKVVRLRGAVMETDEGSFLSGERLCPNVYKADGHRWLSLVARVDPGNPQRLHDPHFAYDARSEAGPSARYVLLRKTHPDRCILWTEAGLFETRTDWSTSRITYPDGSSKYAGFGNDGIAPAQLLLKSVVDVEVDPKCGPKAN
jgi:hypothetical protein